MWDYAGTLFIYLLMCSATQHAVILTVYTAKFKNTNIIKSKNLNNK